MFALAVPARERASIATTGRRNTTVNTTTAQPEGMTADGATSEGGADPDGATGEGGADPDGATGEDAAAPDGPESDPAVTVVVVSYFSGDSLRDCLDSVVTQSGIDARAVVVDNGAPEARASGDLAADADSETATICAEYESVAYIESDANDGFGAGINRGFEAAETDHLAALNPDATFDEGALRRLVDALGGDDTGATAGAAFAAPKIVLADDPDRISTVGLHNHVTGISFNQAADLPSDTPVWSAGCDLGGLSGCAFATTASAWRRVGGFDEEMFLYKDDVDLSWACQLLGERIRYVPDAVVAHDYERDLDGFKFEHIERNRLLVLAKYLPASAAVLLLPSLVLTELLTWAMAATLGVEGLLAKLRSYGVLGSGDARNIRWRGARFREHFPEKIGELDATVPWADLRRNGVVPDSPVVEGVGAVVNLVYRANVALYRKS